MSSSQLRLSCDSHVMGNGSMKSVHSQHTSSENIVFLRLQRGFLQVFCVMSEERKKKILPSVFNVLQLGLLLCSVDVNDPHARTLDSVKLPRFTEVIQRTATHSQAREGCSPSCSMETKIGAFHLNVLPARNVLNIWLFYSNSRSTLAQTRSSSFFLFSPHFSSTCSVPPTNTAC